MFEATIPLSSRFLMRQFAHFTLVSSIANISPRMKYTIEYFNSKVLENIENWPDDIKADYARLLELLIDFGPALRMPHSRAMGGGLFELRPRGKEGIGRAFYCFLIRKRIVILHEFIKKTSLTPGSELIKARKRMKEV